MRRREVRNEAWASTDGQRLLALTQAGEIEPWTCTYASSVAQTASCGSAIVRKEMNAFHHASSFKKHTWQIYTHVCEVWDGGCEERDERVPPCQLLQNTHVRDTIWHRGCEGRDERVPPRRLRPKTHLLAADRADRRCNDVLPRVPGTNPPGQRSKTTPLPPKHMVQGSRPAFDVVGSWRRGRPPARTASPCACPARSR